MRAVLLGAVILMGGQRGWHRAGKCLLKKSTQNKEILKERAAVECFDDVAINVHRSLGHTRLARFSYTHVARFSSTRVARSSYTGWPALAVHVWPALAIQSGPL